ncbi:MAG: sulfur transferase domain-containing protein, partial [Kovacikia sp.]
MEIVRKINDELAIAGPVTVNQLQQLAEEGFQSVLNLRSIDKYLRYDEQRQVESWGLHYVNLPIDTQTMSPEIADSVLKRIGELPKPTLVYCSNAMLA